MLKLKKLFKKSPIAIIVVGVLIASAASAALLGVYVTVTGTAEVTQSVIVLNSDTESIISESFGTIAGDPYSQSVSIENRSTATAPIEFVTSQCLVGGGNCGVSGYDEDGIETSYWSTVKLENKDSNWSIIPDDGTEATLTYELIADIFNYEFEATGLVINEDYSLIYYADEPDRFVNWGGSNPGALIYEFTTDSYGNIPMTVQSINLNMNLPAYPDWNAIAEPNYCDNNNGKGDDFDLCQGAKIWLVRSAHYDSSTKTVTTWSPTDSLFETDLITYGKDTLNLGTGILDFSVENDFAVEMTPGTYTITTEIIPIQ